METVVCRYSAAKLALLGLCGVGMTALSAAIAFHLIPVAPGSLGEAAGWFGTVFFLAATVLIFSRLRHLGADVLTLTATGLTDTRIMPEEIPWAGVLDFGVLNVRRQKFINLQLAPAVEERLPQTRASRMARDLSRQMGVTGVAIGTQGLDVNFDRFEAECLSRLERSHRREPPG